MTKKQRNNAYKKAYLFMADAKQNMGVCDALEKVGYSPKNKPELDRFKNDKKVSSATAWIRHQYNESEGLTPLHYPRIMKTLRLCILEFCIEMSK